MAKKSKAQIDLEYAAARVAIGALSLLPLRMSLAAGRVFGAVAHLVGGRLRRTGERNLEMALPDLDAAGRRRVLRGTFSSLGRQLGLFSQIGKLTRDNLSDVCVIEGFEHLRAARAGNRPVIMFTGHLGAWELTAFAPSVLHYPLSFLVRRIDNPKLEDMVERIRTRLGNRSIDKKAAARPMLRALNSGGTIGILIDLNSQPHEGVFVDYFGIPASTSVGIADLALRSNPIILPIFAPWDAVRRKYVVRIEPPVEFEPTGVREDDARELTQRMTAVIERYVRAYPDQWLWIHKRWNTRPPGEPDLYAARAEAAKTTPRASLEID
ncbi:MAG: lysophospholipid acyltransferase family protein [Pyrinomonadaceae bacterium]